MATTNHATMATTYQFIVVKQNRTHYDMEQFSYRWAMRLS